MCTNKIKLKVNKNALQIEQITVYIFKRIGFQKDKEHFPMTHTHVVFKYLNARAKEFSSISNYYHEEFLMVAIQGTPKIQNSKIGTTSDLRNVTINHHNKSTTPPSTKEALSAF